MKLNQIQVCLDCEEAYVGDYCPKCGSAQYFYLRKYFEPMRCFKNGGHYEPVTIRVNPVQERIQRLHGDPAVLPCNFAGDTLLGEFLDGQPQEAHNPTISDCGRRKAGLEPAVTSLLGVSRILGEAIGNLKKGRDRFKSSSLADLEAQVEQEGSARSGA